MVKQITIDLDSFMAFGFDFIPVLDLNIYEEG